MRVNALVVDLALLGAGAWDFLERVSAALPGLGIVVCTGRSSVAQRVRGLRLGADDWVTKPCHPEEVLARVEAVVRRRKRASRAGRDRAARGRRARDPRRPVPGLRRRPERGPHPARVRGAPAAGAGRGQGAPARGDLPGGLGLRDGPRRPLRRRVHPQGAPEARAGLAGWSYIHTHFGVGYRFDPEAERPALAEPVVPEAAPEVSVVDAVDAVGYRSLGRSGHRSRARGHAARE